MIATSGWEAIEEFLISDYSLELIALGAWWELE